MQTLPENTFLGGSKVEKHPIWVQSVGEGHLDIK